MSKLNRFSQTATNFEYIQERFELLDQLQLGPKFKLEMTFLILGLSEVYEYFYMVGNFDVKYIRDTLLPYFKLTAGRVEPNQHPHIPIWVSYKSKINSDSWDIQNFESISLMSRQPDYLDVTEFQQYLIMRGYPEALAYAVLTSKHIDNQALQDKIRTSNSIFPLQIPVEFNTDENSETIDRILKLNTSIKTLLPVTYAWLAAHTPNPIYEVVEG